MVNIENYESIWFFKVNIGFINLKFKAKSKVLEMIPDKYIHFIVESEYVDIDGHINLRAEDASTMMEITLKSNGKGRLKSLIENILRRKFDDELKSLDKKLLFLSRELC